MCSDKNELALASDMGGFFHDPLGFVHYAFAWGQGDLKGQPGPDVWQSALLRDIGDFFRERENADSVSPSPLQTAEPFSGMEMRGVRPLAGEGSGEAADPGSGRSHTRLLAPALRAAVASGHGAGKTALVSWLILWAMSTRPHLAGAVTANTGAQLADKTWRELALWHKRAVNAHWFRWTSARFCQADHPETWFVSAVPWSRERPEAFAGLHAEHTLLIFDEASAIDDAIWETAEGSLTTPGAVWLAFGNPTRNSGRFFECFHRFRHRWLTRRVDSREARMAHAEQLQQWIEDYGEDSDFVRVRVRGLFPRSGGNQLVAAGLVEAAVARKLPVGEYAGAPKVLGVDVARFGDDKSSLIRRQGLLASGPRSFHGLDLMTFAGIVAEEIDRWRPDAVYVDQGGMGAGVVDRLRQLGKRRVYGVDFGGTAEAPETYHNKRAEMWCRMRDWLRQGALPPDSPELLGDLTGPEYGFSGDKGRIILEKKQDMKKRGLASPDCGDALALTFAGPARRGLNLHPSLRRRARKGARGVGEKG